MGCKCAKSDENGRYICDVTGFGCFYFFPDSKACAKEYGEGPDAIDGRDED